MFGNNLKCIFTLNIIFDMKSSFPKGVRSIFHES